MKKITTIIVFFITFGQLIAQVDGNGNPIFNSVCTKEKFVDDYLFIANYYTLKNNIESKKSSVYVSDHPTLDEIEEAAINLPSDYFIITKNSKIVVMIMYSNTPNKELMVVDMKTKNHLFYLATLTGDITENRAFEIISEKYDSTATIENGILKFNGKEFKIIPDQQIEETILALIKSEKLNKKKPSDIILRSKGEMKSYIITETKEGGKLDFFTEIKGKEYESVQLKPGLFTTKESVAFYKWGRACFDIGINTVEDAYKILAEFRGKAINTRDKEYIKMGFDKEWEK